MSKNRWGRADRESSIVEASIAVCIDSDTSVFMATLWWLYVVVQLMRANEEESV